jgi:16S rRNA (uracil1498-N3)-methyltransferase
MQRVYLSPENISPPHVSLPEDVAHYLRHVLRLSVGNEFIVFEGSGAEYRVALEADGARIVAELPPRPQGRLALTLYQGLPKGKKLPLIIQKATELGVARLVPVQTDRATVRLPEREAEAKQIRWQKIADEAAEQSRGTRRLQVASVLSFADALADWRATGTPGLLPDETVAGQAEFSLRRVVAQLGDPEALAVFIGPEGGLSPQEAQAGRAAGLQPVSLGSRILRTETAAIVVCALLLYEAGDVG